MKTEKISFDLLNRAGNQKERIIFNSPEGKPIAALVPIEDLHYLDEMEQDVQEFHKIREQTKNEPNVSWDALKEELGL